MKGFIKTTKGKIIIGCAGVLLAAVIILAIFLINKPQGYRSISVSEVHGSVLAENGGKAYSAYENMRIGGGYALVTETDSYTRLVLDDDKYIKLEQLSRATFKELGTENKRNTVINLVSGTLTTEIVKPLKLEEEYVINTPNAVLSVRGTYFRTEVKRDTNGDYYTDVYTYGGTVACCRIMPDGSVVDEEVLIGAGYKACVKMDEIITIYVEELIEEAEDKVDPFDIPDMVDDDLVEVYNASANGHKMFRDTENFWNEIDNRDIDISKYKSPYDKKKIPPFREKEETTTSTSASEISSEESVSSSSSVTSVPGTTTQADSGSTSAPESNGSVSYSSTDLSDNTAETDDTANDGTVAETEVSSVTTASDIQGVSDTSEESRQSESRGSTAVSEAMPSVTSYTGSTLTEPEYDDDDNSEDSNADEEDDSYAEAESEEESEETEAEEPKEEKTDESEEDSIYDEDFYDEEDLFDPMDTEKDDEIITPSDDSRNPSVTSTTDDDAEPMISTPSYIYTSPSVSSDSFPVIFPDDDDIMIGIPVVTSTTITTTTTTTTSTTTTASSPEEIIGHICAFENYISDNNATCTKDGTKTAACECGKTDTVIDEGSATGHTKKSATTDATCTEAGKTVISCETCGEVISETEIPATGHTEKSATTDATCTEAGKTVVSCETCGEVISETEIPALGHTEVEETKEPTFTVEGLYRKYCSVCDEVLESTVQERLPALYTEDGDITITSTGYTQGDAAAETAFTGDYVISQRDSSTAVDCAIAIESGTHNVTLDGVNIATSDDFAFIVKADSVVNLTTRNEVNLDSDYQVICSYGTLNFNNCNLSLVCIETDNLYHKALVNGGLMSINNSVIKITSKYIGIFNALYNLGLSINNSNITINSTDYGIYTNSEPFAINSGYLNINTDSYGLFINNDGQYIISGGSIVINGKNYDFKTASDYEHAMIVTGGSVHFVNSIIDDRVIITNGTDELECVIYDTFPTEAERTFTNSDGTSYIYALDEADKADDGKYYIWKPVSVTPEGLEISAVNFPDEVFRTYVSNNFDTDSNGYLSDDEIAAVTKIDVSGSDTTDGGVASLTGIEHFTALDTLYCKFNTSLTSLDTSRNTLLRDISCYETGITEFDFSSNTALTDMNVGHTAITELDVTANTEIATLIFGTNDVTAIDLSKNTKLTYLNCGENPLTELDVSNNPDLWYLNFNNTGVSYIDVSNNTELLQIHCYNCALTCADLTNNTKLGTFSANDNKYSIPSNAVSFDTSLLNNFDPTKVSDVTNAEFDAAAGVFRMITGNVTYTYDCGQGFKPTFTLTRTGEATEGIAVDSVNFPDGVFRNYVSENFDADGSGYLSEAEVEAATEIGISDSNLSSLAGIEYFTYLTHIDISCSLITELDLSYNTELTEFDIFNNSVLSAIDLSSNSKLSDVSIYDNASLTSVDLSNNPLVENLNIGGVDSAVKVLDISNNTVFNGDFNSHVEVETIYCENVNFDQLMLYGPVKEIIGSGSYMTYLEIHNNSVMTDIDLSGWSNLNQVSINDCTALIELDLSDNPLVEYLDIVDENSSVKILNLDNNTAMNDISFYELPSVETFYCRNSSIEAIHLNSSNSKLSYIDCSDSEVLGIYDIGVDEPNSVLKYLNCSNCNLTYLDLEGANALETFICEGNVYEIPGNVAILRNSYVGEDVNMSDIRNADYDSETSCFTNITGDISYVYDCGNGFSATFTLAGTGADAIYINETNFPDSKFRQYVSNNYDINGMGYIIGDKAVKMNPFIDLVKTETTDGGVSLMDNGITNLKGIEYLKGILSLDCSYNSGITLLDLSNNLNLYTLVCSYTGVTSINLGENERLNTLNCSNTSITMIDLSKQKYLHDIDCSNCNLAYVDISNCVNISYFNASGNEYVIPSNATTFDTSTIDGFDPTKVLDVTGADFDAATGIFTNITGDITYTYDCGQGYSVTFTLKRTA